MRKLRLVRPLSSWLPRSSATNRSAIWRWTPALTTAPSSASACGRATFGTSYLACDIHQVDRDARSKFGLSVVPRVAE